jgi:CMP-N,N'-diacetyllegionaminic acid synthase
MKLAAIVPAKENSNRLKNKNTRLILGKPMVYHVLKAVKDSKYVDTVICSTDSTKIELLTKELDCEYRERPEHLASDPAEVADVIANLDNTLDKEYTHLLIVQANFPQLTPAMVDRFVEHYLATDCRELVSCDIKGVTNGALRLIRRDTINKYIYSTHQAFMTLDIEEVHTIEELINVTQKMVQLNREIKTEDEQ